MRTAWIAVLALAVVSCKKNDAAADSAHDTAAARTAAAPAAAPGAKWAGTWAGTGYRGTDKKGRPFTYVGDSTGNGVSVMGKDSVRFHNVSITDTSFVIESDPYMDPQVKAQVVDHVEGHAVGDSAVGTNEFRPTKAGAKPMKGHWTAHRKTG